jgi:hypothetical protein
MEVEKFEQIPDDFWQQAASVDRKPNPPADLSNAARLSVTRDTYLEAQSRGLTLTELLESEEYDPSPLGAPLDAFERQLTLAGINVGRNTGDTVELFYRNAPALMPEFVVREIRRGMSLRPEYEQLLASRTQIGSNRYSPLYVDVGPDDSKLSLRPVAEGAEIPQIVVTEQQNSITVGDYGVALKASYKVLRHRSLAQFKVLLWYIGYRLQLDKIAMLTDVLINGDGNDNAAPVINTDVSGSLDYDDLVKLWAEFSPFELNTLLCHKEKIRSILTLSEFKDPLAGFRFQATGKLVSPLGCKLVRCDELPADLILGIDSRFAVEEIVNQPLMVEFDKIIEQKFEEAVISESLAFAKVIEDATYVLNDSF